MFFVSQLQDQLRAHLNESRMPEKRKEDQGWHGEEPFRKTEKGSERVGIPSRKKLEIEISGACCLHDAQICAGRTKC